MSNLSLSEVHGGDLVVMATDQEGGVIQIEGTVHLAEGVVALHGEHGQACPGRHTKLVLCHAHHARTSAEHLSDVLMVGLEGRVLVQGRAEEGGHVTLQGGVRMWCQS